MSQQDVADDPPVTVVAAHRFKPGKEKAFEEIMTHLIQAAMTFDGHLGTNILRPTDPAKPQYLIIFKFDRLSNLRHWKESKIRQEWLIKLTCLTQESAPLQILTGLETWFTLPTRRTTTPPPRYKMALLTWLAIFPLIVGINLLLGTWLIQLPMLLRSYVLSVSLVLLMTYIVMPRMTHLFARWLYPSISKKLRNRN